MDMDFYFSTLFPHIIYFSSLLLKTTKQGFLCENQLIQFLLQFFFSDKK